MTYEAPAAAGKACVRNTNKTESSKSNKAFSRLCLGASMSAMALSMFNAAPAHAQIVIVVDTPVDNPGGQTVTSADGVTQTVNSGDNIELENNTNDGTVITLGGTHINNDGDDEDVVVFVDNSEDDIVVNVLSTGVLQGVDGVIFFEGDAQTLDNAGLIEGTGEASEAVVYFDRDADGELNTVINSGTITSVGGATIGVDSLLGTDPSSGTVGDEEGIARFRLVNTGTISNTGTDSDADALHFNGDPGTTGGEARGCLEGMQVNCIIEVDVTNSGTISASNANTSNAAIRSESDAVLRGTIVNETGGMITAATNAIRINGAHADHSVTITNAGTIDGQAEAGILIGGTGVTVDNQAGGMITGDDEGIRIDGDSISVRILGGSDVAEDTVPENTVITNSGTISGTADGILTASDTLGAMITNNADGTIMGEEGIDLATGGTVTNNGTITGSVGDAINIEGMQDATVTLGASSTTTGADDAVQFNGTGTNTLTVNSGASITGDLQASTDAAATNVLNLVGSDATLNTIRAFDFDEVNVDGGVFALSSFATGNGAININTGSLLINSGGTTGQITVASGATLGGNGTGGDTVVAAGGIINPGNLNSADNLNLSSLTLVDGSILAFDLGDPNDAAASDSLAIAGDLTLDGTLNVTDVGDFGLGVYSLITYGGTLTDNGLEIGTLPNGFILTQGEVQTSVAGQVNLVISANAADAESVLFFDGGDTTGNGAIEGGVGVWDNTAGNWTNAAGDTNFAWNDTFAIFGGTAGVVTLGDDIAAEGLQFLVDGYTIAQGTGTLALTETSSNIRAADDITATIDAALIGTGGINKVEAGTLILNGANTYTGDTTVAGGTLILNGSLVSDAEVTASATLSGTGTSTGSVTVQTAGAIAPGTDGTAGTLTVGDLILTQNAILAFDLGDPADAAASDRIQVNGDLTLDGLLNASDIGSFGLGVYRLIDYTGTLTDNGLLVNGLPAGFDLEQGSIQVTTNGQVNLIIDRAIPSIQFFDGADAMGDDVIDGGSGSWNLTDTNWTDANGEFNAAWNDDFAVFGGAAGGTVTVDDAITFTGIQFAADGYTIASGTGALTISNGATPFRVDTGLTATISAQIGGTGGLNKLDAGTLVLDGDHTYTGDTVIDGGILEVNGSLVSDVTVNAGGSLAGAGTTGALAVSGTLAPGAGIGTFNATDLSFASGSTLEIDVDPTGASDLVAATGDVTINGGTVSVLSDSTAFDFSTDYTIITAGGAVSGAFEAVMTDLAFLTPTLNYEETSVVLTLRRNDVDFVSVGQTANQIATAAAIESAVNGTLGNSIVNLSADAARDAFDQLSGDLHPSGRTAMVEDNRLVRNAVLNHLTHQEGGNIWGTAWGYTGETDADGNGAGVDRDGFGLVVGADVGIGEGASLGIAVNYTETDFDLQEPAGSLSPNLGEGTVETFGALAYLDVDLGGLRVRTGGGFGGSSLDTSRAVAFGIFTDSLSAAYDGSVLFGFIEAGVPLNMGSGLVEPYVGLTFLEAETEAFTENGGSAALRFEDEIENASTAAVGVRFATADGSSFQLRGNAGYQAGLGELAATGDARFVVGNSFRVAGAAQSRNAGFLQAEASLKLGENSSIGLTYDGLFGDATQDHAGALRLTIGF
ncbi:MAG: autotransporter domain-containing protein [Pseudomonadota bacterium]